MRTLLRSVAPVLGLGLSLFALPGCLSQFPDEGPDARVISPSSDGGDELRGPVHDAFPPDAALSGDAESPDAALVDADLADGSVVADQGMPDAALPDAGPMVDAGCRPLAESCNRLDDDCDGNIDEGLGLGNGCTVGVGACARRGVQICDDQGGVGCDIAPGNPLPGGEECNGIDDDCDGTADENFPVGDACIAGVDQCRVQGSYICGDRGLVCDAEPQLPEPETCNELDDDCDGVIDEDLGLDEICYAGVGACRQAGNFACDGNGGSTCAAEAAPPEPEQCNGVDDDCDGQIDEGRACGPYVASHCKVWLAQGDENRGPEAPSEIFGNCPEADVDNDGRQRCISTRGDGLFHLFVPRGDVNGDDRFAVNFLCEDDQQPEVASWIQRHCQLYLGYAERDVQGEQSPNWGTCPEVLQGDGEALRCTSSGGDGLFRPMQLINDVISRDAFGVAFICESDTDPVRATALTENVIFTLGWYRFGGDPARDPGADERLPWGEGVPRWGLCDAETQVDNTDPEVRCASTGGDGQFRALQVRGDFDSIDGFGIALQPRE
ncbi:MAG: MopE-related protein [Bradymonadia bacterium]